MTSLPIRVRLTIAFALAMLLMLAGAAAFVYLRLRADLDDRIDASLRARVAVVLELPGPAHLDGIALEDPEETFVQLLSPSGEVLDSVGTLDGAALRRGEARRAMSESIWLERALPRVDGRTRVFARADGQGEKGGAILVVGQSLVDRNDALDNVVTSFAIGGALAILIASATGYLLARLGLAPVEAMRRRAREVSLASTDAGLPLPAARDEIRRLAETLNAMLARLRASFERESRFVADASHELRTPIAIIKTELEGAIRLVGAGTPAHSSIAAAIEECDRLTQLAEDLLVIAQATDGKLPIRPEPTPLGALFGGVRDRFVDRASRRGRQIRVDVPPNLIVVADPVRLRQALGNLVENALRYGDGTITLTARILDGGAEIDVSDEGPGFPADLAARAFERFARADRSRSGSGVGLGLSIVQAIATAHRGSAAIVGTAPTTVRIRVLNGG